RPGERRSRGRYGGACRVRLEPSPGGGGGEAEQPPEWFLMTWELAAWGLLALVIGGGFTWYERSRPPARMVALVAALAALAVAGRLAFAAIPNVVATTDIVL